MKPKYYTSKEGESKKIEGEGHACVTRLEIVPSGRVVRLNQPSLRIRPLTLPLCIRPPSRSRAVLICGMRRCRPSGIPSVTLDGNGTCAWPSMRLWLLALPHDFVAIFGAGIRAERARAE